MANGDKILGNGRANYPIAVAVIGAFLGSTGTIAVYLGTPFGQEMARPDPFTGSQATALIARIEHLEAEIIRHTANHPDQTNQFDRRITTLEIHYEQILKNQDRIIERLDAID